jgi:hypothetical protein
MSRVLLFCALSLAGCLLVLSTIAQENAKKTEALKPAPSPFAGDFGSTGRWQVNSPEPIDMRPPAHNWGRCPGNGRSDKAPHVH